MKKSLILALMIDICLTSLGLAQMNQQVWLNQTGIDDAEGLGILHENRRPGMELDLLPDQENMLTESWWDAESSGLGDNYTANLWGWVTIPETGAYTWHTHGDDHHILYVSSDNSMDNLIEVTRLTGWTNFGQWEGVGRGNRTPVQPSTFEYKKGQILAVYGIMFQGTIGHHFGIGWTRPGSAVIEPISQWATSHLPQSPDEILGRASVTIPQDRTTDVPRDVTLSWTAGESAKTFDVYFETSFEEVNTASRTNASEVLVKQNQSGMTYDFADPLTFGQKYYWRIDAVNAPPESTIRKGRVWSFTVEPAAYPIGVVFQKGTLFRTDPKKKGDNWRPTWAADDSQITPMDDGNWLGTQGSYHNQLYRIIGSPDNFTREVLPNYPVYAWERGERKGSWFGYGIVSVDGILYHFISKTPHENWSGPFRGIKLLKSNDNGDTWYRVDRNGNERRLLPMDSARNLVTPEEMFFLEEYGQPHQKQVSYPFSWVEFVKCGKDNSAAKDDYLYIYSPEGHQAHKLSLARVKKDKLGIRSSWEYFVRYEDYSQPVWTSDIQSRGNVHMFPDKSQDGNYIGWYSWLPSVVWNEGLGLYIMVSYSTYAGDGMTNSDRDYYNPWNHTKTGALGFWYSRNPYGPWHQFYYTDYWTVDDPKNRLYQASLSPKWISSDGKEMVLIWSDAMKDENGHSHNVNYTWNQMKITIVTNEDQ